MNNPVYEEKIALKTPFNPLGLPYRIFTGYESTLVSVNRNRRVVLLANAYINGKNQKLVLKLVNEDNEEILEERIIDDSNIDYINEIVSFIRVHIDLIR